MTEKSNTPVINNQPTEPKPARPECHPENLPDELKKVGKFCTWRYVWKNGRWNKTPYNPRIGGPASTTNPATFGDFRDAESMIDRYDGAGVLIYGNVCGIDIDNCVQDDGSLTESARMIIDEMDSYTEMSPSKTGVHIFFTVSDDIFNYIPNNPEEYQKKYYVNNAPKYKDKDSQHEEVYIPGTTTGRYLTMTGDVMEPRRDLEDRTEQAIAVINRYMKKADPKPINTQAINTPVSMMSDDEILDALHRDENWDSKFSALWDGDASACGNDISRADMALLQKLAFYSGGRADVMERLFSQSTLAEISRTHNKWERRSYMNTSINKAINNCGGNFYDPDYYRDDDNPRLNWTDEDREGLRQFQERHKRGQETGNAGTPVTNNTEISTTGALIGPYSDETPTGEQVQAEDKKEAENGADGQKEQRPTNTPVTIDQFMEEIYTLKYQPVRTGIEPIDDLLKGGLLPQSLTVITAAPGSGKTALSTMIFESMAKAGHSGIYLNLEMSTQQLYARSISRLIYLLSGGTKRADALDILQGYRQTDGLKEATAQAVEVYKNEYDENLKYNPAGTMCNLTHLLDYLEDVGRTSTKEGRPAPNICLDYLQLLEGDPREDRADIIKRACFGLKNYAVKFNAIVIIISAQSRLVNNSESDTMAAARDSSNVEYSADLQLGISHKKDDPKDVKTISVTKSRFTETKMDKDGLKMLFHGDVSCFVEYDDREREKEKSYKRY